MNNFDFFILLDDSLWEYLLSLLVVSTLFLYLARRRKLSMLNPLSFHLMVLYMGFSVFILLWLKSFISLDYFIYIILSSLVFILAMNLIFDGRIRYSGQRFKDADRLSTSVFLGAYFSYILLNILTYVFLGIPIFNEVSRLTTYEGSGLGFLARLQPALFVYSMFYIFNMIKNEPKKFHFYLLFLPAIIIGVLSGSRSSFLGIIFAFWAYQTFFVGREPFLTKYKRLILIFMFLSITSFLIINEGDISYALLSFIQRIVATGDTYWYSLPNDAWQQVEVKRPLEYLFKGVLGPLRIIDVTQLEAPIGFRLTRIVNPTILDPKTGPVVLFQIFGLIAFGWIGGILFCAVQGILAGIFLKLSFIKSNSLFLSAIFYLFFISSLALLGDMSYGTGLILDAVMGTICLFLILLIAYFIDKGARIQRANELIA